MHLKYAEKWLRCLFVSFPTANFVAMKQIILVLTIFLALAVSVEAQNENASPITPSVDNGIDADTIGLLAPDLNCHNVLDMRSSYSSLNKDREYGDTLHLPMLTQYGTVPLMSYPYHALWGFDNWNLHKGLNMNIGASVFAAFGKGTPSGAGFAQDVSLMYALPLSKRVTLALGGWISNVFWSGARITDAGLSAVLGYRFSERLEGAAFVRKSLVDKRMPLRYAVMNDVGDRIGASLKYNFSPSFSVQLTVQATRYNNLPQCFQSEREDNGFTSLGSH